MSDYTALVACYRSGQMSEWQWQSHLCDPLFKLWIEYCSKARRSNRFFMVTKIHAEMIASGSVAARMASDLVGRIEVGDYCWSARSSKTGWLKCQAQAVSRITYAALFAEIGVTYGAGDGSTTFNLPDGQGRALIGSGAGMLLELVSPANVAPATDLITVASNADKWITGMKVQASTTGTLPTGLTAATDYFVIRVSATTIKLASTLANAVAGTAIDITAAGSGTHTLTHTLTSRALGDKGGEEGHANTISEMAAHRHKLLGNSGYSGTAATGLGDTGSRSVAGNSNASGNTYVDMNNGQVVVESTGGNAAHNNMQPYLAANLFIYAGV